MLKLSWLRLVILGSIIAILLMIFLHLGHTPSPADVQRITGAPVPAQAHDIHLAQWSFMNARQVFVKFSAPPEVCLKYAQSLLPGVTLTPINVDQQYFDLSTIRNATNHVPDIQWFDLPYAAKGWTIDHGKAVFTAPSMDRLVVDPHIVGGDTNAKPSLDDVIAVRVDLSKGVFYFYQSN